jgi:hypothetical protein
MRNNAKKLFERLRQATREPHLIIIINNQRSDCLWTSWRPHPKWVGQSEEGNKLFLLFVLSFGPPPSHGRG